MISRSNVVIDSELNQLFYEFRQAKANEKEHNGQKIILVRPPFIHLEAGPPIGLAYLQDILAKQGHKVLVWDINLSLVNFKGLDQYNRDFVIPDNHPAVSYAEKI